MSVVVIVSLARIGDIYSKAGTITKVLVACMDTSVHNIHVDVAPVALVGVLVVGAGYLVNTIETPRIDGCLH
jgi:hypothetical protein